MGESSRRENVVLVLNALEQLLSSAGVEIARGRALAAADAVYATA
jgi:aspartate aminotransferase-like enzyme